MPLLPIPGFKGGHEPKLIEQLPWDETEGLSWDFVALDETVVDKTEFSNTQVAVLHGEGNRTAQIDPMAASGKAFRGYKVLKDAVSNQYLGLGHPDSGPDLIVDDPE